MPPMHIHVHAHRHARELQTSRFVKKKLNEAPWNTTRDYLNALQGGGTQSCLLWYMGSQFSTRNKQLIWWVKLQLSLRLCVHFNLLDNPLNQCTLHWPVVIRHLLGCRHVSGIELWCGTIVLSSVLAAVQVSGKSYSQVPTLFVNHIEDAVRPISIDSWLWDKFGVGFRRVAFTTLNSRTSSYDIFLPASGKQ